MAEGPWYRNRTLWIVVGVLAAMWVLGSIIPDSDSPATTGASHDLFVTNEMDETVRAHLFMDGTDVCSGELGTGFLSDTMSCSRAGAAGTHRYVLNVLFASGGSDRGEWVLSDREIGFYITPFGLEPRTP